MIKTEQVCIPGFKDSKSYNILYAVHGLTLKVAAHRRGMTFGTLIKVFILPTASILHVPVKITSDKSFQNWMQQILVIKTSTLKKHTYI